MLLSYINEVSIVSVSNGLQCSLKITLHSHFLRLNRLCKSAYVPKSIAYVFGNVTSRHGSLSQDLTRQLGNKDRASLQRLLLSLITTVHAVKLQSLSETERSHSLHLFTADHNGKKRPELSVKR